MNHMYTLDMIIDYTNEELLKIYEFYRRKNNKISMSKNKILESISVDETRTQLIIYYKGMTSFVNLKQTVDELFLELSFNLLEQNNVLTH